LECGGLTPLSFLSSLSSFVRRRPAGIEADKPRLEHSICFNIAVRVVIVAAPW
jgi:hypothetical protein